MIYYKHKREVVKYTILNDYGREIGDRMENTKKKSYRFGMGDLLRPGVRYEKEGTYATIEAKNCSKCGLLIYEGKEEEGEAIYFPEKYRIGNIYAVLIKGLDIRRFYYHILLEDKIVTDFYAKRLIGRESFGREALECRCSASVLEYNWEKDTHPMIPFEETVMYALHVRGFTKQRASRVKHKGTFLGLTEKIPYLKELGINYVELMPAYEFDELIVQRKNAEWMDKPGEEPAETKKINYWGYGSGNYFTPKASFAFGDPVTEFKDMVKAFHKEKIEIGMEFYFPKEVSPSDILTCILYWVLEYHIDGVHLNGEVPPILAVGKNPLLADTKILCSYLPVDDIYTEEEYPRHKNLACYQDEFMYQSRKLLKGDGGQLSGFVYFIRRNPLKFQFVNYITNHNGFTLADLVSYNQKHNEDNGEENKDGIDFNCSWNCGAEGITRRKSVIKLRQKQMRNALVMLLLAQGTPCLLAGDEIGHTQLGNNNAYCQDNEISWINWNRLKSNASLFEFTKKLLALRKQHPIFRMKAELKVMDSISCGYPDVSYHGKKTWTPEFEYESRAVGVMYCGKYVKKNKRQEDDFFYIAYNLHWEGHDFAVPRLPKDRSWYVLLDTSMQEKDGIYEDNQEQYLKNQRNVVVGPRTIVVLIGKKNKQVVDKK